MAFIIGAAGQELGDGWSSESGIKPWQSAGAPPSGRTMEPVRRPWPP
jgi:hypothetical protein